MMTPFHRPLQPAYPDLVSTSQKPGIQSLIRDTSFKMPPEQSEDVAVQQPLLSDRDENVSSDASRETQTQGTFTRNLGAAEAFGIVVSIVIGSGVFTSPGSIDTNVPSPGIALAIWLIGGILAWTGATTFAELGTAIPGEGQILITCYDFHII
jgi:amino acid permease